MNTDTKRVVVISGSPRPGGKSTSMWLAGVAKDILRGDGVEVTCIDARESVVPNATARAFEVMLEADALVIIFPLYIFCLPGVLIRFLQDYGQYVLEHSAETKKPAVYMVVNCGFPEPDINEEAVRVIESFSEKIGADFRFGVMIGCGGMLMEAKDAPFMKKTMAGIRSSFQMMKDALVSGIPAQKKNIMTRPKFPRRLYYMAGNMGWVSMARKNGLKRKDLYRRPYC